VLVEAETSLSDPGSGPLSMQIHLLEQAAKVITCPQILVNVISRRVRQLTYGHTPLVKVELGMGFADTALSEVIQGKLTYERTKGFIPEVVLSKIPRVADFTTMEKKAA
jgi:DNA-directed RNA polymerase subunit omega